jgi:hypothetical protein
MTMLKKKKKKRGIVEKMYSNENKERIKNNI